MRIQSWNTQVLCREKQRQQKRLAVLQTGAKLFNNKGYEHTSLDDIAKALNVTKRTLYYYVQSKEEILFECNRMGLKFIEDIADECRNGTAPALDRIVLLIEKYAEILDTDFGACLVLTSITSFSEENKSVLHNAKRQLDALSRELIEEGVKDGTISDYDPRLASAAIIGALNWIPYWNRNANPSPNKKIATEFAKLFTDGLRARMQ